MKIINTLENLILEDETVVALGNFDGIHAGHKVILEDAVMTAKENNIKSLCFTFSNHPFNFIMHRNENDPDALKLICRESEKVQMIEDMGFDYLVNVPFDEKMMKMSASEFFDDVIIAALNASVISVGFNFSYGARATGNAEMLYKDGLDSGIEVRVHDAVKIFHNIVSSTLIRETLSDGNIEATSMYLDREYSITDTVKHGARIGTFLGIPTINFAAPTDILLPPNGVYATRTLIDGKEYKSITNIGVKPTVGIHDKTIETHINNFDEEVYGKNVTIIFEKFMRSEKKFDSINDLKKQIQIDLENL